MWLDFRKPTKLSHWAYSILFAQLMSTFVHYTYTVPLPGLVDWSAFLEQVLPGLYVDSLLSQLDPWRALHGRHGCEIHPKDRETSINSNQAYVRLWLVLLEPIASPNSSNGGFSLPSASNLLPSPTTPFSHLPTPYVMPSMILQWFWEELLKIQQCKLASRNSYKTLAKRLFQLYSISGVATV